MISKASTGGLDLCCFEVTNATHKNIKDNNIEAVKLDYCDEESQWFQATIVNSLAFVISIVSDVNNCDYEQATTKV